jgi:alkylation response protein AidB-like acyl-CoA dehydrogenase
VPIPLTADQRALADALRSWAGRARPVTVVRAMEEDAERWRQLWPDLVRLGVPGLAVAAAAGGADATVADLAVALEQCADDLVPGPLLPTALAALLLGEHPAAESIADGRSVAAVALQPSALEVDLDNATVSAVLRPVLGAVAEGVLLCADTDGSWYAVDARAPGVKVLELAAADLSRSVTEVHLDHAPAELLTGVSTDRVHDLAGTLAAAEAAGVASWALRTAVDYANVREQFGRPIGAFQAVKHLCAEMLCRAESAVAVAWDAAQTADDPDQHPVAAAVAVAIALDAAVENAKDCIQVLGGIGYTWEHDAHLYLRRALALRQWLGGSDGWRRRALELTVAGRRRELHLQLDVEEERPAIRLQVGELAGVPEAKRRAAFADSGLLAPHFPRPYGLAAGPALQLLIDEELARAGVTRPDLVIAGWALPTILAHGTPEQIERFVAPTLRGELVWCQLFSEPGAGSDLASLRTRAERVEPRGGTGGGWRLSGQKVWTSVAHRADWGICLARTDPGAAKHRGITYFLVDMRSAGLDVRPLREITGEALFNEIFLDDVFVPDELVVGQLNGGWPLARTTLSHERVAMGGGSSIGDAVERLITHCGEREQLSDPVVAGRLGALVCAGLAGSLLDLRSTLRRLDGHQDEAGSSVRKLIGVRHRQAVAEAALDMLGPDGLIAGEELHAFLNTRCLTIAGGTTQVLLTLAGERILGLPR